MSVSNGPWQNVERARSEGLGPPRVPPHDDGVGARVARLEASMEYVQRDIFELRTEVREIRGDIKGIRTTDFAFCSGPSSLLPSVLLP